MPFRLARAYGTPPPPPPPAPAAPAAPQIAPQQSAAPRPATVSRLIAGVTPGGIDFDAPGGGQAPSEPLAMYRHPADRNAAATGVSLGRSLDVSG